MSSISAPSGRTSIHEANTLTQQQPATTRCALDKVVVAIHHPPSITPRGRSVSGHGAGRPTRTAAGMVGRSTLLPPMSPSTCNRIPLHLPLSPRMSELVHTLRPSSSLAVRPKGAHEEAKKKSFKNKEEHCVRPRAMGCVRICTWLRHYCPARLNANFRTGLRAGGTSSRRSHEQHVHVVTGGGRAGHHCTKQSA